MSHLNAVVQLCLTIQLLLYPRYKSYHEQHHQALTAPTVASSASQSRVSAVAGGGITSKKWTKVTVY